MVVWISTHIFCAEKFLTSKIITQMWHWRESKRTFFQHYSHMIYTLWHISLQEFGRKKKVSYYIWWYGDTLPLLENRKLVLHTYLHPKNVLLVYWYVCNTLLLYWQRIWILLIPKMALQMFPNLTGLVFEQLVIKTNDCNDVNIWLKSPEEGWSLILGRYPDTF